MELGGILSCLLCNVYMDNLKPGVHTNDFAPIHGRRARIHTAPAVSSSSGAV